MPGDDPQTNPVPKHESQPAMAAGILATGIAAALVAIFTSYLGVQGTVLGAMLGAMLGATTSQVVRSPLDRLERALVRNGFSSVQLRRKGLVRGVISTRGAPAKLLRAVPRRAVLATLGLAAAGFLVAMSGLSVIEAATDRPVSAILTGRQRTGTTASNLVSDVESSAPTQAHTTGPGPTEGAVARPSQTADRTPAGQSTATRATGPAPTKGPAAQPTQTADRTPTGRPVGTPTAAPRPTTEAASTPTRVGYAATTAPTPRQ